MKKILAAFCCFVWVTFPQAVFSDELDSIFKKVNDLVAAKNYSKALDELGWARKEIERLHMSQLKTFFPENVGEFKGAKLEQNAALGFTNVERQYSRADGTEIKLSLTGGGSAGSGEGLGGLMAFGKMAAMMGTGDGQESLRISGRTATLTSDADMKTGELTIFLEGNSMLKLDMTGSDEASVLKKFAEALKISELEAYLKG